MYWLSVKALFLAGISERTKQGVENLAASLFKIGQAKEVIAIDLPKHRSCMHLDTVMTHMDIDTFSVYPEIYLKDPAWRLTPKENGEMRVEAENYLTAIEGAGPRSTEDHHNWW